VGETRVFEDGKREMTALDLWGRREKTRVVNEEKKKTVPRCSKKPKLKELVLRGIN